MKSSINTLIEMVISDSKNFIIENGGNVADHLIASLNATDQGEYWYLSDEEAEEYEKASQERKAEIYASIESFLNKNYNYNIADQQRVDILESMKELVKEGEPIVVGSEYNGTNPSVFQEFADTNSFNLDLVVEVYRANEKELTELWNEHN